MTDFLTEIYSVLKNDPFISEKVNLDSNLHFNSWPDAQSIQSVTIVIDELTDPQNLAFADDKAIAMTHLIQIDIYTKASSNYNARLLRNQISQRVSDLLETKLNMSFVSSGKPEYDSDLKLYRSVRRYEGWFYKNIIN